MRLVDCRARSGYSRQGVSGPLPRQNCRLILALQLEQPAAGIRQHRPLALPTHRGMRVLSPRIAPPLACELGSMASTATLSPASSMVQPSVSMSELLPAPGGPDTPTRNGSGPGSCAAAAAAATLSARRSATRRCSSRSSLAAWAAGWRLVRGW